MNNKKKKKIRRIKKKNGKGCSFEEGRKFLGSFNRWDEREVRCGKDIVSPTPPASRYIELPRGLEKEETSLLDRMRYRLGAMSKRKQRSV